MNQSALHRIDLPVLHDGGLAAFAVVFTWKIVLCPVAERRIAETCLVFTASDCAPPLPP